LADTLTGGLTQKVREGAGYDDVVNKNSTAYKAGVVAGTVLDVALTPVNPCGKAAWLAKGVKAISAAQAAGHSIAAGEAFANGDYAEGALSLISARMSSAKLGKNCFTAGTPILTQGGSKRIEELKSYADHGDACDYVLARADRDPGGLVRARRVLQRFVRVSPVLNLHVGGQVIRTTAEHPFYAYNKGWTAAADLAGGDWVLDNSGSWQAVAEVFDSGQIEAVHNLRVAEHHTYFVGDADWGWGAWAHNVCVIIERDGMQERTISGKKVYGTAQNTGDDGAHAQHIEDIVAQLAPQAPTKTYFVLNRTLRTALGRQIVPDLNTDAAKKRPDIIIVQPLGGGKWKVHAVEVLSGDQRKRDLNSSTHERQ